MKYNLGDLDFATEYNAAVHKGPPKGTSIFLISCLVMFAAFFVWADWAELDEVTRGDGRVIPSGKNQVVQSFEGGIIKEIFIKAGSVVKKNDLLLRIDDTGFSARLGEVEANRFSLLAQIVRLKQEASSATEAELKFSNSLTQKAPDDVLSQRNLYSARQRSLNAQFLILKERISQRNGEWDEQKLNLLQLKKSLTLARTEEELKAPLVQSGILPQTDILKLQREIVDLEGKIQVGVKSLPRLEAAIREAKALKNEQLLNFRQKAQAELSQKQSEVAVIQETLRGVRNQVAHAEVRAPVDGVVNVLNLNTIGEVVKAGATLVEIVPQSNSLSVEVKIKPSDIAFIHSKQPALVKISAYDFSIYGGLEGYVTQISADSTIDERSQEVYYLVTIKTRENYLRDLKQNLVIFPGMVASVDILTGKKSVLDYLLKPINKARNEALRER